jgi:hypothetical protein
VKSPKPYETDKKRLVPHRRKQVTVDDETFILHIFHKATLDNYVDTVNKLVRSLIDAITWPNMSLTR